MKLLIPLFSVVWSIIVTTTYGDSSSSSHLDRNQDLSEEVMDDAFYHPRYEKLQPIHEDADIIPGSFIVLYHPSNDTSIRRGGRRSRRLLAGRSLTSLQVDTGIILQHEYHHVLDGAIAIENVTDDMLDEILDDPNVAQVVPVRLFNSNNSSYK
jgi:hypothetical protein